MEDAQLMGLDLDKPFKPFVSDHGLAYTSYAEPTSLLHSLPNPGLKRAGNPPTSYSAPNSPDRSSPTQTDCDALFLPESKHLPPADLFKPTVSDLDILEQAERTPTELYTREERYSRPRSRPLSLLSTSTSTSTNSDAFYTQDRVYTKSHNRGLSLRSSFSLLPEPHASSCCSCLHCGVCPSCAMQPPQPATPHTTHSSHSSHLPTTPNYMSSPGHIPPHTPSHSHYLNGPVSGHHRWSSLDQKLNDLPLSKPFETDARHARSGSIDAISLHPYQHEPHSSYDHDHSPDLQGSLSPASPTSSESNVQNVFRTLAYKERQVLQARQNLMDAVQELETFRTQLTTTLQPELSSPKEDTDTDHTGLNSGSAFPNKSGHKHGHKPRQGYNVKDSMLDSAGLVLYDSTNRPRVRVIPDTSLQTGIHARRFWLGLAVIPTQSTSKPNSKPNPYSPKTVYRIDETGLLELSKVGPFTVERLGTLSTNGGNKGAVNTDSGFLISIKFLLRAVRGVFSVIPGYRPEHEFMRQLVLIPCFVNPTEVLFDLFLYHNALNRPSKTVDVDDA